MAELQDEVAQMRGYRGSLAPFRCPSCKETFDTRLELRVHYQMSCMPRFKI